MTITPPDNRDLDEFIDALIALAHACGSPGLRELAKSSDQVAARRKKHIPVLRPLSLTSISDTLNRRRKGPPAWGWVATYVLTCLHHAQLSGIEPAEAERDTLARWHARYRRLRSGHTDMPLAAPVSFDAAAPDVPAAAPPPGPSGGEPGTGRGVLDALGQPSVTEWATAPAPPPAPPDRLTMPRSLTTEAAGTAQPEPGRVTVLAAEDDFDHWLWQMSPETFGSLAQRRYRSLFAEHGVELLTAAEAGAIDAAARLGILLLCQDRPAEARAWLRSAAAGGDEAADVLMHAAPSRQREMAAELAYELTLPGYQLDLGGSAAAALDRPPTGAEVYYRSAALAGHPGAAYRLALMDYARGEDLAAFTALRQAAVHGHPAARHHFQQITGAHAPVCPGPHRHRRLCTSGPCWPPRPTGPA